MLSISWGFPDETSKSIKGASQRLSFSYISLMVTSCIRLARSYAFRKGAMLSRTLGIYDRSEPEFQEVKGPKDYCIIV